MSKKKSNYDLNRKEYEIVKKMDHSQMTLWAESVYKRGYHDGANAAQGLTSKEMLETLIQIKGIGEKKAEVIVQALEDKLSEKQQNKNEKIDCKNYR